MNNNYLNPAVGASLNEVALKFSQAYQQGEPFPNIGIQDFFNEEFLSEVLAEFPDLSQKESIKYNDPKEIKLAGKGEKFFGPKTKEFMRYLNSEEFLEFLQVITGIEEPLIGDPYFAGGGQHEIKKGGLLKIHADFNKHPFLKLDRRINVLVYLNKDWKEEYGGHFQLWDKEMKTCVKKILPQFNTLAMFSTTSQSYHGHPDPLTCPDDRSRKSLALYYYTNGRPLTEEVEAKKHSTLFQERKGIDNAEDFNPNKAKPKPKPIVQDSFVKKAVKQIVPPIVITLLRKVKNK